MKKMSHWGIGPLFAFLSLCYAGLLFFATRYFHLNTHIHFIPARLLMILGIGCLVLGAISYILSLRAISRAYNSDVLVTDGVFRCCRHPLYASWVVFLAPGIACLMNNGFLMPTPLFMYVALRLLVRTEEVYLEKIFGEAYLSYKKEVPCILPYGCLKKR